MRTLPIIFISMFLISASAWAVTVNLTDGRSVEGTITKKDAKSIEINTDGVNMTYYADEIKDIDGKAFEASEPAVSGAKALEPAVAGTQAPAEAVAPAPVPVTAPTPAAATAPEAPAVSAANASAPTPQAAASAEPTTTVSPEKKALILKFIDVFGTRQALISNFQLMLSQIEKQKPEEATKIRDRVKVDEIIDRLIPVYDRNFSQEDLNAFIAFYSSPEGQKLIKTIPILMRESVQESVKYMEEKFPEAKATK